VIRQYLKHICLKNKGSLAAYEEHFEKEYLDPIEKTVQVSLADKGLLDVAEDLDTSLFQRIS